MSFESSSNFTSGDEVTRWFFFSEGVGLIVSLSAARCNCSLNNHLSGVASLPFNTGLHSVLSCSEASPTRTVAFLCLPGQLHQPLHQGWLLETFLSQWYIHLMWSRLVSRTLTEPGKQEESPSCRNWRSLTTRLFCSNHLITTLLAPTITHYKLTDIMNPRWHTQILVGLGWVNVQFCHSEVIQAPLPGRYTSSRHKSLFGYSENDFYKKIWPQREASSCLHNT